MKKLNFDIIFKIIIIVSLVYSLFLLTEISNNSGVGRYQLNASGVVIDTKIGTVHYLESHDSVTSIKMIK